MHNLYFFLITMIFMYIGRKIGWIVSKIVLYNLVLPIWGVIVLCIFWGISVAYLIHSIILWQHPHLILRIIFGYALGCYVAYPSYGLWDKSTLSSEMRNRETIIDFVSSVSYIISIILFEIFCR